MSDEPENHDFSPGALRQIAECGLVRGMEFHAQIGSTNDRALEIAAMEELCCPFLVLTAEQSRGRGRGDNRWWSARGALTFSIIFDTAQISLPKERWPQIALAAGVAVSDAIESHWNAGAIALKWPNDLYLEGHKAGGILVESPGIQSGRYVVGIGLNINNCFAEAPSKLRGLGTSLADVAGRPFEITQILLDVIGRLTFWSRQLSDDLADVICRWRSRCLLTGKRICLRVGEREVAGVCRGVDDFGLLLIETPERVEAHLSGTVEWFER